MKRVHKHIGRNPANPASVNGSHHISDRKSSSFKVKQIKSGHGSTGAKLRSNTQSPDEGVRPLRVSHGVAPNIRNDVAQGRQAMPVESSRVRGHIQADRFRPAMEFHQVDCFHMDLSL